MFSSLTLCILLAALNLAEAANARGWNTNFKKGQSLQVQPQPNLTKRNQTKRNETKGLQGSCADQVNFEDSLDKLAYSLFVDPAQKASADGFPIKQVSDAVSLPQNEMPKAAAEAKSAHAKLASARLQDWLDAVARTEAKRKHVFRIGKSSLPLVPPACPNSVPLDDPYWSQPDSYWVPDDHGGHVAYNICMYSDNCQRTFTNYERLASLRATLYATHQFLTGRGATYMLYGGSAIGAYRCKDVLPWDLDQDVAVMQHDLDDARELFYSGVSWNYSQAHEPAYIDLADHFIPGFTLMEKYPGCLPLIVVDQSTGFFVDLFPMTQYTTDTIYSPWVAGRVPCNAAFFFSGCAWERCEQWSTSNTYPISGCQINGAWQGCAHDLFGFLKEYYGSSVKKPDIPVRNEVDADKQ